MQTCCPSSNFSALAQPTRRNLARFLNVESFPNVASFLNDECLCKTLDMRTLGDHLGNIDASLSDLPITHPNMFAQTPVFISKGQLHDMQVGVQAIERLVRSATYQRSTLAKAGQSAQHDFGPIGGLLGYDFHLTQNGPKLIEINTNAGGAFLNNALYEAQKNCCGLLPGGIVGAPIGQFPALFADLLQSEWQQQRGTAEMRTIAIVDDNPTEQFLFPEFVLAQNALKTAGFQVLIADGNELTFDDGVLTHHGTVIDLVYNRLVDFDLSEARHSALHDAYVADAVVVTPNPRNHALLADKRNLCTLSSANALEAMGVSSADQQAILSIVPDSHPLKAQDADHIWQDRKNWFFKPIAGHGSKAVYRGDKLTKRVWQQLLTQNYVMQKNVPPSQRIVAYTQKANSPQNRSEDVSLAPVRHKTDIRLYTFDAEIIMAVARLYQGQTTNLRTPLGGFAPVYIV